MRKRNRPVDIVITVTLIGGTELLFGCGLSDASHIDCGKIQSGRQVTQEMSQTREKQSENSTKAPSETQLC